MSKGQQYEIVKGPDERDLLMSESYLKNFAELGYRHLHQVKFRLQQGLEYYALITRMAAESEWEYVLSGYCAAVPWTVDDRAVVTLKFVAKCDRRFHRNGRGVLRFRDIWLPNYQDLLEDYRHFTEVHFT